jgi:hypothetical protein
MGSEIFSLELRICRGQPTMNVASVVVRSQRTKCVLGNYVLSATKEPKLALDD